MKSFNKVLLFIFCSMLFFNFSLFYFNFQLQTQELKSKELIINYNSRPTFKFSFYDDIAYFDNDYQEMFINSKTFGIQTKQNLFLSHNFSYNFEQNIIASNRRTYIKINYNRLKRQVIVQKEFNTNQNVLIYAGLGLLNQSDFDNIQIKKDYLILDIKNCKFKITTNGSFYKKNPDYKVILFRTKDNKQIKFTIEQQCYL